MDHSDDDQVGKLFERIKTENNGRLDVLVNNAYAGVNFISENSGKKFYLADPVEQWDAINGVGLRNHFLCTVFASRMMVEKKNGLIVNVSSPGGLRLISISSFLSNSVFKAANIRIHCKENNNLGTCSMWLMELARQLAIEWLLIALMNSKKIMSPWYHFGPDLLKLNILSKMFFRKVFFKIHMYLLTVLNSK